MESLLYISRSTMAPDEAEREINSIVTTAVARNPVAGLTGALLFTGTHFAQVLEGEGEAIYRLITTIADDPRHDQLKIIARAPLIERRFPDWSMAYFGPSQFVTRHVTRLLNKPSPIEFRRGSEWLTDLLKEFSADRSSAA